VTNTGSANDKNRKGRWFRRSRDSAIVATQIFSTAQTMPVPPQPIAPPAQRTQQVRTSDLSHHRLQRDLDNLAESHQQQMDRRVSDTMNRSRSRKQPTAELRPEPKRKRSKERGRGA